MDYRKRDTLDISPSLLGFGTMRLPVSREGRIDQDTAQKMVDMAIASGVNYFDTAYMYMNGESEEFISRALKKYPRESYYLTTKLPTTKVRNLEEAKAIYAEQRRRLNTPYLDCYFLHNVNGKRWRLMVSEGIMDWMESLLQSGEVRHLGFSFHGTYTELEEIITARKWDLCQIQLNYMDIDEQSGIKGYELTEKMNVPLIIMEPVKGGALANPPEPVREILGKDQSPSSWALRWAASLPNVMTVLSGMSHTMQVEDNLNTFNEFRPLTEDEQEMIARAREAFKGLVRNGCTTCRYCMPCPSGVNIPLNFKLWNEWAMFGKNGLAWKQWKNIKPERRMEACLECGQCESQCPQGIHIIEDLKAAAAEMDYIG